MTAARCTHVNGAVPHGPSMVRAWANQSKSQDSPKPYSSCPYVASDSCFARRLLRLVAGRGCLYVSLEWQTKLRLRQPIIMITIIIIIVIIISIIIIIIGAAYFYCLWAWPALVARNKAKYKTNSLHLLWKLVKHLSLYLLLFVVVVVALRLLLEKPINLIKNK